MPKLPDSATIKSSSDDERIRLAKHAEALLADPVILAAQQTVILECTKDWVNSSIDNLNQREEAYMKMKGMTAPTTLGRNT